MSTAQAKTETVFERVEASIARLGKEAAERDAELGRAAAEAAKAAAERDAELGRAAAEAAKAAAEAAKAAAERDTKAAKRENRLVNRMIGVVILATAAIGAMIAVMGGGAPN